MAVIYGTLGPDNRNGTLGNDTIYGWPLGGNTNSSSGNDVLYGKAGNDKLYGGTGNDKLYGEVGLDTLYGGKGRDYLSGGSGNDKLFGEAGSDTLFGGLGNDILTGGTGNDTYSVDSIADTITESFNQGFDDITGEIIDLDYDTVNASVSYKLSSNLERLTLIGPSNISGTGNASDNTIVGNDSNNALYGKAGDDTLEGDLGIDKLYGGVGNDTYIVDSTTDTIAECLNRGTDTVLSSVNFTLGANLENLTLYGTSAINGRGNTLDNQITGNDINNYLVGGQGDDYLSDSEYYDKDTLVGGAGNDYLNGLVNVTLIGSAGEDTLVVGDDPFGSGFGENTLIGGTGNDTYIVERTTDTIIEKFNAGVDTVSKSFYSTTSGTSSSYTLDDNLENLTVNFVSGYDQISALGNSLNNVISIDIGDPDISSNLFGGAGHDYLSGGGGSKTLNGGTGNDILDSAFSNDTLTGGAGADVFSIRFPSDSIATITDFSVTADTINISADGFGGGLTAGTAIAAEQFRVGSAPADANDRIIYNQNTGALFFDADGIGGAERVRFTTLSTGLAISSADIFII